MADCHCENCTAADICLGCRADLTLGTRFYFPVTERVDLITTSEVITGPFCAICRDIRRTSLGGDVQADGSPVAASHDGQTL